MLYFFEIWIGNKYNHHIQQVQTRTKIIYIVGQLNKTKPTRFKVRALQFQQRKINKLQQPSKSWLNFNLIVQQEGKKYKNEIRTFTNVTLAITGTSFDLQTLIILLTKSVSFFGSICVIVFNLDLLKITFIFHIVPSGQSLGIKNTD